MGLKQIVRRLFGRNTSPATPEPVNINEHTPEGTVIVTDALDGEDAMMKNALLALKSGKVVYGEYEDGKLTSRISRNPLKDGPK